MPPEYKPWLDVALQLPIVAFFAWFILKRDKDYQLVMTERDNSCKEFIATLDANHAALLESVHINAEKSIARMAESVDRVAHQVAKNTTTVIMHDATVKGVNPETVGSPVDIIRRLEGT